MSPECSTPPPASQDQQCRGRKTQGEAPRKPERTTYAVAWRPDATCKRPDRERPDEDGEECDRDGERARQPMTDAPLGQQHQQQHGRRRETKGGGVRGIGVPRIQVIDRRVEDAGARGKFTQAYNRHAAEHHQGTKDHRHDAAFTPRHGHQEREERDEQRHTGAHASPLEQAKAHFLHGGDERASGKQGAGAVDVAQLVAANAVRRRHDRESLGRLAAGEALRQSAREMVCRRIGVQQRGSNDPHRRAVPRHVQRQAERRLHHAADRDERVRIGMQRPPPCHEGVATVHEHRAVLRILQFVLECLLGSGGVGRHVRRLMRHLAQGAQLPIDGVLQPCPLVCCLRSAHLCRGAREAREPPLGPTSDNDDDDEGSDGDDERGACWTACIPAQCDRATDGGEDARREVTYARLGEPSAGGQYCHSDGCRREQRARTGGRQQPFLRVVQDDLLRNRHRRDSGVEHEHPTAHQGDAAGRDCRSARA